MPFALALENPVRSRRPAQKSGRADRALHLDLRKRKVDLLAQARARQRIGYERVAVRVGAGVAHRVGAVGKGGEDGGGVGPRIGRDAEPAVRLAAAEGVAIGRRQRGPRGPSRHFGDDEGKNVLVGLLVLVELQEVLLVAASIPSIDRGGTIAHRRQRVMSGVRRRGEHDLIDGAVRFRQETRWERAGQQRRQ